MISYKDTLNFPDGFYQFKTREIDKDTKETNDISDDTITEWIEKCIIYLKENLNKEYTQYSSGNTKVIVERGDNEFFISVMKNYWEKEIPIDCEVEE